MPTVLIPLAEGCEELEAVTLIDLLRRAEITVITASLTDITLITASRGVRLMADTTLENVIYDDFDMIVLPEECLAPQTWIKIFTSMPY